MGLFNFKKMDISDQFADFPRIGAVMASKMVTEKKKKVKFMYREKPTRDEDSGWRIFSGFEDQEYVDNPNNTGIYNPTTILKIDSSIANLLLKPLGSVFEREDENSNWYEVNDFEFEDDYPTTQRLTDNWSIEISNLFTRRREEDGDLVFAMKGKTVRLAIWNSKNQSRQQLYDEHKQNQETRDQKDAPTIETFELGDNNVSRIGYMIEESDNEKRYKVIYGFSIVDGEVVQAALYFDKDTDKEWALETWRTIKYE
jgi:hypothetical protein